MTGRSGVASGLAVVLVVLAAFVAWVAISSEVQTVPKLSNSDTWYESALTAGVFAIGSCILALWNLRRVWDGRGGWWAASVSYALALIALFAVLAVGALAALADH